ncbi:MAG: tetratricopeptide repeat protein [Cyclobacteriaceae bacterium]|nr:tetratricopeptide repeat protein [Cyclobacteriaceae bacterium]
MPRVSVITLIAVGLLLGCQAPKKEPPFADLGSPTFAGSASCQSCHTKQFQDWQQSDHFLAMQEAADSTVRGDFNNRTLVADGVTSRFFKRDGKYFINTQGDDGKNHDYEVRYTFGYFPLQQYLIEFSGGRLQPARASWNSRDGRWFHQYAGQKIPPHDWLHWTGNGQNWNTMCATCHSTNLRKNYAFTSDSYQTTWTDINVGCESCHGPGSKHIAYVQSPDYSQGARLPNSALYYSRDTLPRQQLNTCAPCHARKADISAELLRTDELLDDLIPQVISTEFYHADGQIRDEDYEYGSFAQSKMYHLGIRCSNCHQPHSGKLVKTGNDLCMSCHVPKYNTKEHTFHALNTEASQCVSCHMTTQTYMGNDVRRDHSFRIPRPDQSVSFGTPNACNGCHTNQSASWAAKAVVDWYGPKRAYHFSDDLVPGSQLDEKSGAHLARLLADRSQPAITRATAATYLGRLPAPESLAALQAALTDKQAIVRYYTLRALQSFPPDAWMQAAAPCLNDGVRAVRIAAADLFHQLPKDRIPSAWLAYYQKADAENRQYLSYQTDFAVGNVMLADYELQGGDHAGAIAHYVRGLQKDSLMNYARFNLASAYNALGKNDEALKTLKEAVAVDPKNDRAYYNLGLLCYEMQDEKAAEENFRRALRLNSRFPGLYYNYGLLLQQRGDSKEAERILLRGYDLEPFANNLNYALAVLYLQQRQPEKAMRHAAVLRRQDPNNPDYQGIFKSLGI